MRTILSIILISIIYNAQGQIYNNNIPVNIPDGTNVTGDCGISTAAGNANRLINVPIIDTILDPSKLTFNLNIAHTWSGDVVAELRTPAGNSCALIKRLGANSSANCGTSANMIAGNTLSFSANNTIQIPYQALSSGENIPAGVYKPTEGNDSTHYPTLIPLCNLNSFLNGVSISGDWALVVYDNGVGDVGSIQSWQIVFAPGFSDPVSPLSVDQEVILSSNVTVLGNPFLNQLSIRLNEVGNKNSIKIYSIDGKEIYNENISAAEANTIIHFETGNWVKGMYTLQAIVDGRLHQPIKIIKN